MCNIGAEILKPAILNASTCHDMSRAHIANSGQIKAIITQERMVLKEPLYMTSAQGQKIKYQGHKVTCLAAKTS